MTEEKEILPGLSTEVIAERLFKLPKLIYKQQEVVNQLKNDRAMISSRIKATEADTLMDEQLPESPNYRKMKAISLNASDVRLFHEKTLEYDKAKNKLSLLHDELSATKKQVELMTVKKITMDPGKIADTINNPVIGEQPGIGSGHGQHPIKPLGGLGGTVEF